MSFERRHFLMAACGLLGLSGTSMAQETRRTARIGWLGIRDGGAVGTQSPRLEGLRAGLRNRGWIEGENLVIEQRSGDFANAHELAVQLVQANVAMIVVEGGMIFRVLGASDTTPLLFHVNGDPVEAKLVASYARPGGNRTGTTSLSDTLSGKRVELLKEALPQMKRLAAIANQGHPGWTVEHRATHAAARQLGLELTWLPVFSASEVAPALESALRSGAEGIVAVPDNLILNESARFADFASKRGVPMISGFAAFAEAGNLMSYGPELRDVYFKLATYADKLLKGAKPADLPVENPDRIELVINLRTARAMGLKFPRPLLARADRSIE